MWSVGLDVHLRSSTICILDENGKTVKQMKVRGHWLRVIETLKELKHPFAVCYEASCGYGHLHDRLRQIAKRFTRNTEGDQGGSPKIGSYFGLVPCQDQSADKNRLGHITRQGPSTVRNFLAEAAWQGIRHSAHIRSFFERVQGDDPQRKKIALIATAHYLIRAMHALLRTGETWHWDQETKKAA